MITIKLILAIIILIGSDLISLWGIKQYNYGDKWIKITFIILGLSGTTTGILAILIRSINLSPFYFNYFDKYIISFLIGMGFCALIILILTGIIKFKI